MTLTYGFLFDKAFSVAVQFSDFKCTKLMFFWNKLSV